MAETIDSASPPGESTKPLAEVENLPAVETASAPAAADSSLPAMDTSLPEIDSTLPAMDTSLPPVDPSLPSIESSLPQFDSSVPALPSIDTSLPTLDTTLPATDSMLHDTESHSFLDDTRQDDTQGPQPGTAQGASNDGLPQQTDSYASDPAYQNGAYQYSQQPAQQQQQQPQSQPLPQDQQQPQQIEQSQPQEQQHQQQHHHHHHHQQQQYQPQHQYQPQQYQQQPQQQQQQQQPYQPQQQYQQQYQQQSPEMYNQQAGHPPGTMQAMDHNGVQGQSHIPQAPIGSPMPSNIPPMPSVGQYMTGYPTSVSPMNMNSNYQLPGDPNKMLSSGRHKKEVKRRTKTGCLTCRKRRIKCDEGHPVCRNCVKSKRDCLGYDPVFRPQSTTPSAIQPAPNPPSLVISPQEPGPYPAAPPGYVPAASQPFAPSLQSESSAQSSTEHNQFDYGAAIDPALEAHNNSGNMASVQHATNATDGGLQTSINAGTTGTDTGFRVKQVQISDLLALRGIAPPPPHPVTSLPPGRLEEIQAVFLATYAPAIDRFFETPWFQEKALPHAMANAQLMAEYSALIDAFNDRNLEDPNVIARLESFEASVIWSTITLCRHVMNMSNGSHGQDFDLLAAVRRLDVIEALLAGDHMETNPLAQFPVRQPAADPPALTMQITQRSLDFWSCVGHFLTLHDNEASSAKEIDDTLGRCRTVLDTTENRDVIYSIAIARHVGQRWADFPHSIPQPSTTNEKDAGAKLYVAQKFLEQQAAGSGTTQVSKRICGMAVRSWFVSRQ